MKAWMNVYVGMYVGGLEGALFLMGWTAFGTSQMTLHGGWSLSLGIWLLHLLWVKTESS